MYFKRFAGVAIMVAALAGCSKPAPVVVAPPPPAPVGHVYPTIVAVPAPTSRRIHITPVQQVQIQQAFNVIALKSALMVGALSCGQQDKYDAFMTEFQPHILSEQHVMDSYFRRIAGYSYHAKEDDFVTLLANNQSVTGINEGSMFCLNNQAEFNAVMSLHSPDELDRFVTAQAPSQP